MKHKVGDVVQIRSKGAIKARCVEDRKHLFIDEMFIYCGEVAKITQVYDNTYAIDLDSGNRGWQDWMFEPIRLKLGDKVKIKSKEWYDRYKDINGSIKCYNETFVKHMADFCGNEYTINNSHFENL